MPQPKNASSRSSGQPASPSFSLPPDHKCPRCSNLLIHDNDNHGTATWRCSGCSRLYYEKLRPQERERTQVKTRETTNKHKNTAPPDKIPPLLPQAPARGKLMDPHGKTATRQKIGLRRVQSTAQPERELQRLFKEVLPHLLRKPASTWTKTELWQAVELYFKRPSGGLFNFSIYDALEAALKGEPVDPYYFLLSRKKGRAPKYTRDTYLFQWESMERLRLQIATEKKVAIDKVRYKEVAWRMSERAFANRGLKAPDFKIRLLATRYEIHYKALKKKKKTGEI